MQVASAPPAIFHCLTCFGVLTLIDCASPFARSGDNDKKRHLGEIALDFALPADLVAYLAELDQFITREIEPIEDADDNIRFFDHRREWARTDFDNGGLPRHEWEALLRKVKNLADAAGHLRFAIPKRYASQDGSNLWMAVIRAHVAANGRDLHND